MRSSPLYGFASDPHSDLLVNRDRVWYHSTRQRLVLLMRQLFASSSLYPRPARLELAYVKAASCLLEQLSRPLRECVIVWVEYVLAMTQHDNEAVRQEANDTLASMPQTLFLTPCSCTALRSHSTTVSPPAVATSPHSIVDQSKSATFCFIPLLATCSSLAHPALLQRLMLSSLSSPRHPRFLTSSTPSYPPSASILPSLKSYRFPPPHPLRPLF